MRSPRACERDELIEGTISQRVKGGLSVTIRGGVKAFLPGSQVDLRPIRNFDKLIGQTYQFKVIKFNKKRGNIVLSRRVLLEKERDEQKTKTLETLEEGKVVKGVIKNITEYGAFVDLGGIDGLLHITDMSWGRVNHPSELFQVGDEVTVRVLKYNAGDRARLARPQADPGRPLEPRRRGVPAGQEGPRQGPCRSPTTARSSSSSRASRASSTSARCRGPRRSSTRASSSRSGQELECQVLEVDAKSKRISLGLKQLEPDPWTLFTEKYKPGDKIGGKVRSITDYGVFIGIEEGVDGMVHKSDISWTAKVNNPSDLYKKGDDVEAIILSINHDEKKVCLGVKQLWDDPWPTIFNELPPGQAREVEGPQRRRLRRVRAACATASRGSSRRTSSSSRRTRRAKRAAAEIGDEVEAEIANIDTQERRSRCRCARARPPRGATTRRRGRSRAARRRRPRRRRAAAEAAAGGTIGELIKQKLGAKLAHDRAPRRRTTTTDDDEYDGPSRQEVSDEAGRQSGTPASAFCGRRSACRESRCPKLCGPPGGWSTSSATKAAGPASSATSRRAPPSAYREKLVLVVAAARARVPEPLPVRGVAPARRAAAARGRRSRTCRRRSTTRSMRLVRDAVARLKARRRSPRGSTSG